MLTPSGPQDIWHCGTARSRQWSTMLGQLGKLVTLTMPTAGERQQQLSASATSAEEDELGESQESRTPVGQFLQQMITAVTARVRELRRTNPDRPVILVGWGVGAAVNCQVASMEAQAAASSSAVSGGPSGPAAAAAAAAAAGISGLVCLGFPMYTLDGIRGEPDDPILELRVPILFVIGQNAAQSRPDDVEDMREKLRGESGLVIVGGADDQLRVSKHKKKSEAVTQSMVDRCIADDVREFLCGFLGAPPPAFAVPAFSGGPAGSMMMDPSSSGGRKSGGVTRRRKASLNKDGSPVRRKQYRRESKKCT